MNLSMSAFLDTICDSPMTAVMPDNAYTHFHVMDCIIKRRPTEEEFDLFFQYIQRMDLVYQIAFLRSCTTMFKDAVNYRSLHQWVFDTADTATIEIKFKE